MHQFLQHEKGYCRSSAAALFSSLLPAFLLCHRFFLPVVSPRERFIAVRYNLGKILYNYFKPVRHAPAVAAAVVRAITPFINSITF
jgi:hypothetical protein